MDDFLQKLKKVVRMVLYGPAISQSDCRKVGPYQLPYSKRLYTLRDKFSCNAVNVVYQITCAGCKRHYIGETQNFHQRMNLHKSDVTTLNTDCLADLHINWCLNINYEHLKIPYFYCMTGLAMHNVCGVFCGLRFRPTLGLKQ